MPRPSRVAIAAGGVVAIVVAGLVTGGVLIGRWIDPPSPTTTVTADDGSEVVLDWRDFPAHAYADPAEVLAAPRAEEVEDVGEAELDALALAVDATAPLDWSLRATGNDEDAFPTGGGNGYGGPTMHWIYNSPTNEGLGLAEDADWHAIAAALQAELEALGYDELEWDFDREPYPHETQAERDADVESVHGSLDPDAMWMWSGMAERDAMWVWITIWDERRASAPSEGWSLGESGVSVFVGGTIISEADEEAYADGVAPFEGLVRPESTHSD